VGPRGKLSLRGITLAWPPGRLMGGRSPSGQSDHKQINRQRQICGTGRKIKRNAVVWDKKGVGGWLGGKAETMAKKKKKSAC